MHDLPAKHKKRQPKGEMSGRTHNENHRRFGSWQQPRRRAARALDGVLCLRVLWVLVWQIYARRIVGPNLWSEDGSLAVLDLVGHRLAAAEHHRRTAGAREAMVCHGLRSCTNAAPHDRL